ncbi:MAG: LysR family transcriptional regulator [Burkholderiaceae bacterium]|nr:MAG: LysR family transcriptional regulator [Burkholderiaceae bacterium]
MPSHMEAVDGTQGNGLGHRWRSAGHGQMLAPLNPFYNRNVFIDCCVKRINYELDDLRALRALEQFGSFNKAADALCITPSALSRRIAKLETAVGGLLVERTTRRMAFTALGSMLLLRADPLLESLDGCMADTVQVAHGKAGRITLGCLASVAYAQYPAALHAFRDRFPDVQVSLRDDNGARVRTMVLEREVDFGVTTLWEPSSDLATQAVADDSYVVTVPPDHPFAARRSVRWSELAACRLLGFKQGSATRQQVDAALAAEGLQLNWCDEVDQLSSMMALLATGRFISVLPGLLAPAFPALASIRLAQPRMGRRIYLMRRRDRSLSLPASALWEAMGTTVRRAVEKK